MENFRHYDIEEAIDNHIDTIIEHVFWHLSEEQELYRDRVMEIISDCDGDETAAISLTTDQKISVVEEGADEHGFGNLTFTLKTLRSELESYAVLFIHLIAEGRAFSIFSDLFDFMEEHGLQPEQMRESNNFGWFPHVAEREEENCTIYEYRNVEDPGNHIDVWEIFLGKGWSVFFEVRVEED